MTDHSWNIIIDHALEHLPGDIDNRRKLLSALVGVMPPRLERQREIALCLSHLDSHIISQRELRFPAAEAEKARGSGRLGDAPMARGAGRVGDDSRERGIAEGGRR